MRNHLNLKPYKESPLRNPIERFCSPSAQTNQRGIEGVSLIEVLVVISVAMIACAMCIISMKPALNQTRVANAHNTILATLRQAREIAIAERRVYIVTFVPPRTLTVTQAATGTVTNTFSLPNDVQFDAEPGIPNTVATTPDSFGTGGTAIDFDQGVPLGSKTAIYFQPDGSGQDINSNINNGVVYIARPGELLSSRAITVWGATGRIRGWRLYVNGASKTWKQQ
jgi:Tfp pilus assembly protein FimT